MPSVKLKEPTTIEALEELLLYRLSDRCGAEIKSNRLRLVENNAKGCIVSLQARNGETICSISGFMPSKALRAALLVGIMIALSLTTSLILGEFNILVGGAIPFIIAYFTMNLPSRDLVADITVIISSDLAQTAQPRLQSSRWWPIASIAVCAVFLLGTLAVIKWDRSKPAAVSTPEETTSKSPQALEPSISRGNTASPKVNDVNPAREELAKEYSLVADLSGRIDFLHPNLKTGEIIRKETVIARIDPGNLISSLQRVEEELRIRRVELARLEAEESVSKELYEMKRNQLALAQTQYSQRRDNLDKQQITEELLKVEERQLLVMQQEVEHLQRNLDHLANRKQLMASRISGIEWEQEKLNANLDRAEISLPFDVRIEAVNVKHDDFVSIGSVLIEATKAD